MAIIGIYAVVFRLHLRKPFKGFPVFLVDSLEFIFPQ